MDEAAVNPALGKRGGRPETAILPRTRAGAASVTTNPTTPGQTARLERYLATKNRQQYEQRLAQLGRLHGIELRGPITDPAALFKLNHRAAFAANSITATYRKEMLQAKAAGRTGLAADRAGWKPDQVFVTEMNTADQYAVRDFYANHPELAATATGHVSPDSSSADECQDWIDAGSQPLDYFPPFPLHVRCPHGVEPDAPPPSTVAIPQGTQLANGSTAPGHIHLADVTARLLTLASWWTAGMQIVRALGDATPAPTTASEED